MNKKHGFLFGFAVIAIAAIFTLAGCDDGSTDDGDGKGGGGGVTTSSFEGEWKHSYNNNPLTVTKVPGQDKFTLVYTSYSYGTYTYTLSYTGAIAEFIQDYNPDNPLGKGVPFTGTGTRTSGNGYNGGSGTTDVVGLFKGTEGIAITTPAATDTPAGYLLIDGTDLFVYYEDENASSPIIIGGKRYYGDQKFYKPSN